jgi:hypothetical protein
MVAQLFLVQSSSHAIILAPRDEGPPGAIFRGLERGEHAALTGFH